MSIDWYLLGTSSIGGNFEYRNLKLFVYKFFLEDREDGEDRSEKIEKIEKRRED